MPNSPEGGCSPSHRSEEHTSELQSHRDLHSFPTRRSSDLDPLTETSRGGSSPTSPSVQKHYPRVLQGLCRCLLRRGLRPPPPLQSMGPCHRAPPQCQTPQREDVPPLTDRKSTRLNSSHTEIYTLSLHDALPILTPSQRLAEEAQAQRAHLSRSTIPECYKDFADVFSEEAFAHLPPCKAWDHAIELHPNAKLPRGRMFPLSQIGRAHV